MEFLDRAGLTELWAKIKSLLDGKLDKSGGTLTGNLSGQYLTGTWLQTTASTQTSGQQKVMRSR